MQAQSVSLIQSKSSACNLNTLYIAQSAESEASVIGGIEISREWTNSERCTGGMHFELSNTSFNLRCSLLWWTFFLRLIVNTCRRFGSRSLFWISCNRGSPYRSGFFLFFPLTNIGKGSTTRDGEIYQRNGRSELLNPIFSRWRARLSTSYLWAPIKWKSWCMR